MSARPKSVQAGDQTPIRSEDCANWRQTPTPFGPASSATQAVRRWCADWIAAWNRFWFTPAAPQTLGLIRLLAGLLIFYTHLVWSLELETFFGAESVIPPDYRQMLGNGQTWSWSHFDWLPGDSWLWPVHIAGLLVMFLFAVGCWTRVTSALTALLVISYANRATGAQFGLDQINSLLATYLAIGPSGDWLSVDQWRRGRTNKKGLSGVEPEALADDARSSIAGNRRESASASGSVGGRRLAWQGRGEVRETVLANIAIRLIQVHLCVIYLFAGLGKLQGETWWSGQAIWYAVANLEYQTMDLTWLADHMWLVNLMTWGAVAWETSYPFLVWPRLSRPLMLAGALLVHLGIGLAMGMMTFGLAMIIANLAFVPASTVKSLFGQSQAGAS